MEELVYTTLDAYDKFYAVWAVWVDFRDSGVYKSNMGIW